MVVSDAMKKSSLPSRLRLQAYTADLWEDSINGVKNRVNQVFLKYQHSLGAHGAHKF